MNSFLITIIVLMVVLILTLLLYFYLSRNEKIKKLDLSKFDRELNGEPDVLKVLFYQGEMVKKINELADRVNGGAK